MKITVRFRKTAAGKIEASIRVANPDDYPSALIFGAEDDYPAEENFELRKSETSQISKICDSPEDAEIWAKAQISALACHLQRWREIRVPESYEVEI